MGVYIMGMEMPKRCGGCFLRVGECKQRIYMEDRPHDCPLVPIPPHGRLIDADALSKNITGAIYHSELRAAPTIIPAEEGET